MGTTEGQLFSPERSGTEIAAFIADHVPDWPEVYEESQAALRTFFMAVGEARIAVPRSAASILLIAANEYQDLLLAACFGEGRRCLASARTLYELNVAFHDVMSDQRLDNMYSDWHSIGIHLRSGLTLEESTLKGNRLRSYRHNRRTQLRDSKGEFNQLLSKYGNAYRRDWAGGRSLFDRATTHEQDDLYDFYRVASGVLHGTQLGVQGLTRGQMDTTRLGPALAWAPTGLLYGAESFDRLVKRSKSVLPGGRRDIRNSIARVRRVWPSYEAGLEELDLKLWPSEPAPSPMAVYAMRRGGLGSWFIWEPDLKRVREAEQPTRIPNHVANVIDRTRAECIASSAWDDPNVPKGAGGWISIVCAGVVTDVKPNTEWIHAGEVMIQDPLNVLEYEAEDLGENQTKA